MTPAQRQRAVRERVRLAAAMERGLASDIRNWLVRVGRVAAAAVRAGKPHAAETAAFAVRHRLERILRARLTAAAEAVARLVIDAAKASGRSLETKGLVADILSAASSWVKGYAAERVAQIAETTRRIIRRVIDRGQGLLDAAPTPPRALAWQIEEATAGEIGKRRAIRIARTETHVATERGNFEATREMARTLGDAYVKRWASVHDARTRPDHVKADGQTVDIDGYFIVGGERMLFCGDPSASPKQTVNCRCVTLYEPAILAQAA